MKLPVAAFALCLLCGSLSAQTFLVLKDGQKITYTSLKKRDNLVTVKTVEKKKIDVKVEDILGKCDLNEQKFYHMLPITPARTGTMVDLVRLSRDYDLIDRQYEGTVNFYERITSTQGAPMPMAGGGVIPTSYNNIQFFVEKNGEISEVKFRSGILPAIRRKRIDSLAALMNDCPEIMQKLQDENFEFGHDNVIKLIRSYNILMYKPVPWPLKDQATIIMYSRVKRAKDQKIMVSVNDSTMANIPVNGTVAINISTTNQNKVCIESGGLKTCDILYASPYFVKQFEIYLNEKKGSLEIERKTYQEAQKYLMEIRKAKAIDGN